MAPAVLTHYIDSQRYRLENQVGIKVLLPEHEEQQRRIDIAYIKVGLAVPACQKNSGQTEHRRQQIYQQHRLPAQLKQYYIPKFH